MRAKKAAGLIARFPGGRKSGPEWFTFRMRQRQALRELQEARAEDDRRSPSPPARKRGRPSKVDLIVHVQFLGRQTERSAMLELLLRRMEEAEQEIERVGYVVRDANGQR